MEQLYASLIGPLLGYYYPCPRELDNDENKFRAAMNTSKLKDLWHSIYTESEVDEHIQRFGGHKLVPQGQLDYNAVMVDING